MPLPAPFDRMRLPVERFADSSGGLDELIA